MDGFQALHALWFDFLCGKRDDQHHKVLLLVKELIRIIAWTVRAPEQREAAHKWADQIVFDGDPQSHRAWRPVSYLESLSY